MVADPPPLAARFRDPKPWLNAAETPLKIITADKKTITDRTFVLLMLMTSTMEIDLINNADDRGVNGAILVAVGHSCR